MSSEESDVAEGSSDEEEQPTGYTCKKCKTRKVFYSKKELEDHRKWHKNRPGPASRKRTRNASPTPSSATLFSIVQDKRKDQSKRAKNALAKQKKNAKASEKDKGKVTSG